MLLIVFNSWNVLFYTRYNLVLGIPDVWFVLSGETIEHVIRQCNHLPFFIMTSQLCPEGVEATMWGLMSGAANLALTLNMIVGPSPQLLVCLPM